MNGTMPLHPEDLYPATDQARKADAFAVPPQVETRAGRYSGWLYMPNFSPVSRWLGCRVSSFPRRRVSGGACAILLATSVATRYKHHQKGGNKKGCPITGHPCSFLYA